MNRPPTPIPDKYTNESQKELTHYPELPEENQEPKPVVSAPLEKSEAIIKSNLFIKSYIDLKSLIKEENINQGTMITILKRAMEMVETIQELKGVEQKDFAVLLVRELIDKSKLSQEQKQNCLMVIDLGLLDHVVDFVVDATKGNTEINVRKIKKLFKCCRK